MTRKHYKAIADILNKANELQAKGMIEDCWLYIVHNLSDYMAIDNPLFNRVRFQEACGLLTKP